jgi:hypothetical protein
MSISTLDHLLLDVCDRFSGVESLRTGAGAVENGMTTIQPERIFESVQAFACRLVAAVDKPPVGLKQDGRTEETVPVPPVTWAARRAAEA